MTSIAQTLSDRRGDFINSQHGDDSRTQQTIFEMMTKLAPIIDRRIDERITKYTGIKALHRASKTESADLQEVIDGLRDFIRGKGIHLITKGKWMKQTVLDENNPTIKALNTLARVAKFNIEPLKDLLIELLSGKNYLPEKTLIGFNKFLDDGVYFNFDRKEDSDDLDLDALLETFPSRPDHSVITDIETAFEFLNGIRKFSKVVDPVYA